MKKIKNYSNKPLMLKLDLRDVKEAVFLPDYNPGSGLLPTGSVVSFDLTRHVVNPEYLGNDVGCGMRFLDLSNYSKDFIEEATNKMAEYFIENKNGLGSLGKGNHFLTFYRGNLDNNLYALIHSGSREKGLQLYKSNLFGSEYIEEHNKTLNYAKKNREFIQKKLEDILKIKSKTILDSAHNFLEIIDNEIVYRKGAVKMMPEQEGIIPSSMGGEAYRILGNKNLKKTKYSMCHGTGRKMSRSKARDERFFEDKNVLKGIYFPYFLPIENFSTELPPCYQSIEDIKPFIEKNAKILDSLKPIASVMI